MKRALALVVSTAAVLALTGAALSTSADIWKRLHRPLHIPHIAPGSPCPVSQPDPKGDLSRIGYVGTAWGTGPAYPGGLGKDRPVLQYWWPIPPASGFLGSDWSGNKVLWIIDQTHVGPVLFRGRQLDGPNELRFSGGDPPLKEMRVTGREWNAKVDRGGNKPSYTRVRVPGCYGYQVDGLHFSRIIVFEAKMYPPGSGDLNSVLAGLRASGLSLEFDRQYGTSMFGVPASLYRSAGEYVDFLEFPDEHAAEAAATHVSPDGHTVCFPGVCQHADSIAPPHWYRSGRVLAEYVGWDATILLALEQVLGPPFAGHE